MASLFFGRHFPLSAIVLAPASLRAAAAIGAAHFDNFNHLFKPNPGGDIIIESAKHNQNPEGVI